MSSCGVVPAEEGAELATASRRVALVHEDHDNSRGARRAHLLGVQRHAAGAAGCSGESSEGEKGLCWPTVQHIGESRHLIGQLAPCRAEPCLLVQVEHEKSLALVSIAPCGARLPVEQVDIR